MKQYFFIYFACSVLVGNAQNKLPETELFSPLTNLSLHLYKDSFDLALLSFASDVINSKYLYRGNYSLYNDTLFLYAGHDKVFRLRQQTFEKYAPINLDTLQSSQLFLAWTIHYANGRVKQSGGWTKQNNKEGIWQYYDSTGHMFNAKAFKDGVLINDNYKFSTRQ